MKCSSASEICAFHAQAGPVVEVAAGHRGRLRRRSACRSCRRAPGAGASRRSCGPAGSIPGPARSRPGRGRPRRPAAGILPGRRREAPDWPWSMSITVIWSAAQPSAIALPRRSYWRIADSVLFRTCLRVDWRTYSRAVLARWAAVTFEEAVSVSTGAPSPPRDGAGSGRKDGSGAGQRDGEPGQGVDELGGRRPGQRPWRRAAGDGAGAVPVAGAQVRWARARRQAVTPLPVSTPSPSGNALARACRAA